ncbi:MAG: hypothetical protein LBC86_00780 [Oscillospiraceae bacterium]|jgi:hypothetical protein|nr:hypothetical protein [Oscillospiraceae bacterium]
MKRITSLTLALFLIIALLTACGNSLVNDVKNSQVKFAFEDTGYTYGEVLEAYCSDIKWRTFTSNYVQMIEFSGTTPNDEKVVIQWVQSVDSTYDICWAWTLNGKEQDILIDFKNWILNAAKAVGEKDSDNLQNETDDLEERIESTGIIGTVFVTYALPYGQSATREEMEAAKLIIEARINMRNLINYEINISDRNNRLIVRFSWDANNSDFDAEQIAGELGKQNMLTFREGYPWYEETGENITDATVLPLILTSADIESASPKFNDSLSYVELIFNESGKEKFSEATGRLAGTDMPFSIWIDDYCLAFPKVHTQITNGQAAITANLTYEETVLIAETINGGALHFKLEIDALDVIRK